MQRSPAILVCPVDIRPDFGKRGYRVCVSFLCRRMQWSPANFVCAIDIHSGFDKRGYRVYISFMRGKMQRSNTVYRVCDPLN